MQTKSKNKTRPSSDAKKLCKDKGVRRPERNISQQLNFEKLISKLSADLINLPFDQIGKKIDDGLKLMVESLDIDRSLLHEFSEDKQILRLFIIYCKPT